MSFNLAKGILGGVWAISVEGIIANRNLVDAFREGRFPTFSKEEIELRKAMAMPEAYTRAQEKSPYKPGANTGVIAVIPYKEVVVKYPDACGVMGTDFFAQQIMSAADDPEVVGIILAIDSPGGSVNAVENPSRAIAYAKSKKPIVAHTDNLMASGGYWIPAGCDYIYAQNEMCTIGSIGVCRTMADYDAMLSADYNGARVETHYGDKSTNKHGDQRAWLKGDNKKLQASLNQFNQIFIDHVMETRGGVVDEKALDGSVFLASEALSFGLIDGMKSFAETIERVFELADERKSGTASNQKGNSMKVLVAGKNATIDAINAGLNVTAEELTASNAELAESGLTLVKTVDYTAAQQLATDAQSKIDTATTAHQSATGALTEANTQLAAVATALGLTSADGKYTTAEGKEVTLAEAATTVVAERDEYGKKSATAAAANATERVENEEKEEEVDPVDGYYKKQLDSF